MIEKDSTSMNEKKPHRFYFRHLENDLEELSQYLTEKQEELLNGTWLNIDKEILSEYNKYNGPTTQLGSLYNIFNLDVPSIVNLKSAIRDAVKDACDYYELDFESLDYMIHGWFNLDYKTEGDNGVNPLKNEVFMHDHMGGEGAPVFHGYYCVNAEPSITYYKIDGKHLYENHNENNRLIVSETGHPHGRDDWYEDKPRITIAYDISPLERDGKGEKWIKL
jgi:hypothetical protein